MESATYYAYIPFMFYPTFGNVQSQKSDCLFATRNAQSSALIQHGSNRNKNSSMCWDLRE